MDALSDLVEAHEAFYEWLLRGGPRPAIQQFFGWAFLDGACLLFGMAVSVAFLSLLPPRHR